MAFVYTVQTDRGGYRQLWFATNNLTQAVRVAKFAQNHVGNFRCSVHKNNLLEVSENNVMGKVVFEGKPNEGEESMAEVATLPVQPEFQTLFVVCGIFYDGVGLEMFFGDPVEAVEYAQSAFEQGKDDGIVFSAHQILLGHHIPEGDVRRCPLLWSSDGGEQDVMPVSERPVL